jgi:hypothetical protein
MTAFRQPRRANDRLRGECRTTDDVRLAHRGFERFDRTRRQSDRTQAGCAPLGHGGILIPHGDIAERAAGRDHVAVQQREGHAGQ